MTDKPQKSNWRRLFVFGLLAVVGLPCMLTSILFSSWEKEGPSMAPSMPNGTGFFASRFGAPEPGDVIVYDSPEQGVVSVARVIAEGGQTVEIVDGVPHVDGEPLERQLIGPVASEHLEGECYAEKLGDYAWAVLELDDDMGPSAVPPYTVPEGHYYVLGDNRDRSNDSRFGGAVPAEDVRGVLAWIYRPGMDSGQPKCLPPEP